MAITAAITLSSATASKEQVVVATVTVTNSGSSSVSVVGVETYATATGQTPRSVPVATGVSNIGPGAAVSVAGSNGTRELTFGVVAHAAATYDIGAVVKTNDGAITQATTTTLAVS